MTIWKVTLKAFLTRNFIEIGVVYQKLVKFKNGPEWRENSLYFIILLRQRQQHIAGFWKDLWCLWWKICIKSPARKRFARFRSGNFKVKDEFHSGRPITEKLMITFWKSEHDRRISSHDIAHELKILHQTVLNHLQKATGFKKKLDVWVPHELSVNNEMVYLIQFFNQKPQKFDTDGIIALPRKWGNIVDNNGEYLVWINWS